MSFARGHPKRSHLLKDTLVANNYSDGHCAPYFIHFHLLMREKGGEMTFLPLPFSSSSLTCCPSPPAHLLPAGPLLLRRYTFSPRGHCCCAATPTLVNPPAVVSRSARPHALRSDVAPLGLGVRGLVGYGARPPGRDNGLINITPNTSSPMTAPRTTATSWPPTCAVTTTPAPYTPTS